MAWFHLIFGFLLFVTFTITGRFMRIDFPEKEEMDQFLRVLMRSRHIYILLSALIHMALGVYAQIRPRVWQKILQLAGSVVLTTSSLLLVWAFVVESYEIHGFSAFSQYGLYTALAGVGLHLIGGLDLARLTNDRQATTRKISR